jgi:hypothetical protein
MFWRVVSIGVVVFWAVMTGLLIRASYFPGQSLLSEVPPRVVLDLFLKQAMTSGSTLHFFNKQEKIGHANFYAARTDSGSDAPVYRLRASGSLEAPAGDGVRSSAGWNIEVDLANAEDLKKLNLDLTLPSTKTNLTLKLREGEELPAMELRQDKRLLLDTQGALAMAGMAEKMGGLEGLLGLAAGKDGDKRAPTLELAGREGLLDLAGRKRRCFILTIGAFEMYQIRAVFTEAGELARVDLPQGYKLLEPLIHGLEPDLVEK